MADGRNRAIVSIDRWQVGYLKDAVQMAEEWRGSRRPDEWEEFDERIVKMRTALKAVERDRKRLRKIEGTLLGLAK